MWYIVEKGRREEGSVHPSPPNHRQSHAQRNRKRSQPNHNPLLSATRRIRPLPIRRPRRPRRRPPIPRYRNLIRHPLRRRIGRGGVDAGEVVGVDGCCGGEETEDVDLGFRARGGFVPLFSRKRRRGRRKNAKGKKTGERGIEKEVSDGNGRKQLSRRREGEGRREKKQRTGPPHHIPQSHVSSTLLNTFERSWVLIKL